jgi:hypothetical protein
MPRHKQNGSVDADVQAILDLLNREWKKQHPKAKFDAYRIYPTAIRVRIIDPSFRGIDWCDRNQAVWNLFEQLPLEIASQITMVVLVTPGERKRDAVNVEFEDPIVYPL